MIRALIDRAWRACWEITLGTKDSHLLIAAALHARDCEIERDRVRALLLARGLYVGRPT
jgi:hypothetical protein